ncbi:MULTISPECIES: hypothetical protein [Streptomyces]|uniref:hypothetical protein n=1 Tax=Streptomyces TaxID=1883 RepID=UPI001E365163|nr:MULTISPECIES: hypothetical protein [Streptomyces]UFQ18247.1 hypothetical protein J2N69_26415 [Streptomyces huasconensis]WCL87860.1 hypothetical protein PPN52_26410 [Streptomyces sp. JCM 35825]
MGWINKAKADAATTQARDAYARGQNTIVCKIIEAQMSHRSTGIMTGVGDQIEAIEAEGWTLYNMAAAEGKAISGERSALICLFRRR